jgi:mannosyltransferase
VGQQARSTPPQFPTAASPAGSVSAYQRQILLLWYSPRFFALALLTISVILGAFYRFHGLARWDLNGDEGIAWAAAVQPNLHRVVAGFWQFENGGKLPLFDILLHGWMRVFGDGLFAMRAMSAMLGTAAIVLLFVAVGETGRWLGGDALAASAEMGAAFAALFYALNVTIVASDRTAREFALLTVAELAQIVFFVRAQRRGAWPDYLAVAVFTALMLPINYTASFLLAAEALWLGVTLIARAAGSAGAAKISLFRAGFAVMGGIALLAPVLPVVFASSHQAIQQGAVSWIKLQPLSWPYTVFRDVIGQRKLFRLAEALIAFGIIWRWRAGRLAWGFLAAWMVGPVLAVYLVTYLISPMEFPRYVLIAFVGMFALAGFGAGCIPGTALRILVAAMIIHFSIPPIHNWSRKPRDAAWRGAAALADRISSGGQIAVCPPMNLYVVRYYLPAPRRRAAVAMEKGCGSAPVVIVSGRGVVSDREIADAESCFPHVIARMPLVEVRSR